MPFGPHGASAHAPMARRISRRLFGSHAQSFRAERLVLPRADAHQQNLHHLPPRAGGGAGAGAATRHSRARGAGSGGVLGANLMSEWPLISSALETQDALSAA